MSRLNYVGTFFHICAKITLTKAHTDASCRPRGLNPGISDFFIQIFVYESSEVSGESAHLHTMQNVPESLCCNYVGKS